MYTLSTMVRYKKVRMHMPPRMNQFWSSLNLKVEQCFVLRPWTHFCEIMLLSLTRRRDWLS